MEATTWGHVCFKFEIMCLHELLEFINNLQWPETILSFRLILDLYKGKAFPGQSPVVIPSGGGENIKDFVLPKDSSKCDFSTMTCPTGKYVALSCVRETFMTASPWTTWPGSKMSLGPRSSTIALYSHAFGGTGHDSLKKMR